MKIRIAFETELTWKTMNGAVHLVTVCDLEQPETFMIAHATVRMWIVYGRKRMSIEGGNGDCKTIADGKRKILKHLRAIGLVAKPKKRKP